MEIVKAGGSKLKAPTYDYFTVTMSQEVTDRLCNNGYTYVTDII